MCPLIATFSVTQTEAERWALTSIDQNRCQTCQKLKIKPYELPAPVQNLFDNKLNWYGTGTGSHTEPELLHLWFVWMASGPELGDGYLNVRWSGKYYQMVLWLNSGKQPKLGFWTKYVLIASLLAKCAFLTQVTLCFDCLGYIP